MADLEMKKDKEFNSTTRFAPANVFPVKIEINIYGQKTAFFSFKEDEMFAAILESPAISQSMKAIFDFCWEVTK